MACIRGGVPFSAKKKEGEGEGSETPFHSPTLLSSSERDVLFTASTNHINITFFFQSIGRTGYAKRKVSPLGNEIFFFLLLL